MPHASSLPAQILRRLARRPDVAAALLQWRNAYRLRRGRVLGIAALCAAATLGVLSAAPTGSAFRWLAGSPLVTFAISACLFGLSTVRRHERIRYDAATSWLAALPVRSSSMRRLVWGAAARLLAALVLLGLACAVGRVAMSLALRLALVMAGGALAGTLAGSPLSGRAAAGSPGWHYASVRRPRRRWATAPSLIPLSYWPVAQGRIFSRPSTSRVVLFALLAIPAGRRDPGEVAIAVAAGCITAFTLLSLSTAAVRAAGDAARWLAPTGIRLRRFIAAFLCRVALKQAAVLAATLFLACAIDYPEALGVGLALAVAFLGMSWVAAWMACVWAGRRVGLGTVRRGAR